MAKTIVLITLDSLRFDVFQEYVNSETEGFLEELYADGVSFLGATAGAPWSLPSYGSIFTGLYPSEHGGTGTRTRISPETPTLMDRLREAGFETGCFTANPFVTEEYGLGGWDHHEHVHDPYLEHSISTGGGAENKYVNAVTNVVRSPSPLRTFVNGAYRGLKNEFGIIDDGGKKVTQRGADWISTRDDDQPCFIFLNYMDTHAYHRYLSSSRGRLRNIVDRGTMKHVASKLGKGYYEGELQITDEERSLLSALMRDELKYVDSLLETFAQTLTNQGRLGETTFIVCSDHGEAFGERGFSGHLAGVTEPLIRTPLLISSNETEKKESTDRVSLTWLKGTIESLAGIADEEDRVTLFNPQTYPSFVGAENTGRLRTQVDDVNTVSDRYFKKRVAVFHTDEPNKKYVKVGDEYSVRTVEPDSIRESDGTTTETAEERVSAFTDQLETHSGDDIELAESTEEKLKNLGYL